MMAVAYPELVLTVEGPVGPTVSAIFFRDYRVYIGILGLNASAKRKISVTWDPTKTNIVGAWLFGSIWSQIGTEAALNFNGSLNTTHYCNAVLRDYEISDSVDVTGLLDNGINEVEALVWKPIPGLEKSAIFTAELKVGYEGIPPKIEPVIPIEDYLIPIVIGGIVVLGVAWFLTR